jgi:hypothetical protein
MPPRKRLLFFLLIGLLTVAVGVIPDLVSDELKAWCLQRFGPSYPWYFIGFFVVGCFALLAVSGDFKDLLPFNRQTKAQRQIKIAWSQETKHHLQTAKEKLKDAQPEETIKALSHLKNAGIDEQLNLLSIRLAQHRQDSRLGILNSEQKEVAFNRIAKDLFDLIKAIESQLAEGEKENQQLRDAFRQRYRDRLTQKLASRQPVNLRRLTSTEGTSERVADTFVPYNSEEIKEEIGKTFQAAHGRLLIVGQPGAGKTTLLLQLADRLFDLEADALPIVINLTTWESGYRKLEPWMKPYIDLSKWQKREDVYKKLESWLEVILAAELNINKAGVQAVLYQSKLILLLDGLDEIKWDEAINSCLAAIADYGAASGRRFVITCRIEEYKRAAEDARVNMQIEIGPLTGEQLEAELTRMGREQPEAIPLLQAIQKDPLLRQAVETPFYFNTLQLLFAGRLPVFSAGDLEGRKAEIKEMFVAAALQNTQKKEYPPERAQHWLAFLASRMNKRNLVVFELRDLQYDWWRGWSKWDLFVMNFIKSLVFGLVGSLVFGLVGSLVGSLYGSLFGGLVSGLVGGLVSGLVFGLYGKILAEIETRDIVKWSAKTYLKHIRSNLVGGLVFGLAVGLGDGLAVGLVSGLAVGLFGGLVDVTNKESSDFLQIKSPYQRFYASMKVLHFSISRHWLLRRLLHKKGALPLHLVNFLNEMTARHLLETDGATWRFRHRIIQDYFAGQWVEPEQKN